MSPESAAQKALICEVICAMKDRLRLAQSISRQPFEQIGFLGRFSRLLEGGFRHCKKRDSRARWGLEGGVDFAGLKAGSAPPG